MSDKEQLSETDQHALTIAIMNRKVALAEAEKTLAKHELAEMSYKYLIAQFYVKYGLKTTDSFTETGEIMRSKEKDV